ncbi:alpha/beta hydrolase [Sulfuricystis multivorans]|uniref:alpha/beta hydrolase n=1 Tax=Sulfuricystis multivorans TaxID=2211108 RepID=UPI000F84E775|nr:alpha/beta hydrolase [Sulfuricystis multivorans]
MQRTRAAGALAAFSFLLLAGCVCGLPAGSAARVDAGLNAAGFARCRLASADFPVLAWLRKGEGKTLTVIIEGDGAAWFNPRWPPADPTPEASQAAALAQALAGPVAYLARPCQFERSDACRLEHWTLRRFAPEIVSALDRALDELKRTAGASRLKLVGHSGGGTLAVLLAQRRQDVSSVVTLMAPLAVEAWTRRLDISPLTGLDPMGGPALSIPAIHVAGGRDEIVPPAVIAAAVPALGGEYRLWPQADHACWPVQEAQRLIGRLP